MAHAFASIAVLTGIIFLVELLDRSWWGRFTPRCIVVTTIDGEMGVAHAFASIAVLTVIIFGIIMDRSWCGRFTPRTDLLRANPPLPILRSSERLEAVICVFGTFFFSGLLGYI